MNGSLDIQLAAAHARYAARRPHSSALFEQACRVLPGGSTRSVLDFRPFSFRVARAEGSRLVDVDGIEYIDFLGDYSAGLLGHDPGPVATAVSAALERGWSFGATHVDEIRLAELVCQRFPSIEQVRFTNSGTEANLMALQLARHCTGRDRIVVFDRRVPRRVAVLRPRRRGAAGTVRLRAAAVQRHRRRARRRRRLGRGADRRTDDGRGRLHPCRARIPRRSPRRLRSLRRAADLRRGDDVAHELRRRAAALRRGPGPDHVGQVPRRRDDVRCLRWTRRPDGRVRPAAGR